MRSLHRRSSPRSVWSRKPPRMHLLDACDYMIYFSHSQRFFRCRWIHWPPYSFLQEDAQDLDALCLAKSYFDLKEYDRAAYFLRGCRSQKAYFLYMYSRYLVRCFVLVFMWIFQIPSLWKWNVNKNNILLYSLSQAKRRKMTRRSTAWVRVSASFQTAFPASAAPVILHVFGCRSSGEGSGTKRGAARTSSGAEQKTQRWRAGWIRALSVCIKLVLKWWVVTPKNEFRMNYHPSFTPVMGWFFVSWICWRRRWRSSWLRLTLCRCTGDRGWSSAISSPTLKWYVFHRMCFIQRMSKQKLKLFCAFPSWSPCLCQTAGWGISSWRTCTRSCRWSKRRCRSTRASWKRALPRAHTSSLR